MPPQAPELVQVGPWLLTRIQIDFYLAFFTFLTSAATAVLAFVTWRLARGGDAQLRELRRQREGSELGEIRRGRQALIRICVPLMTAAREAAAELEHIDADVRSTNAIREQDVARVWSDWQERADPVEAELLDALRHTSDERRRIVETAYAEIGAPAVRGASIGDRAARLVAFEVALTDLVADVDRAEGREPRARHAAQRPP